MLFGCDGLDGFAGQLDDSVTSVIKYITPFDVNSKDSTVSAFVEAYRTEYGKDPDQFAADGYDAVMTIYEAMKAANVTDVTISAKDLAPKLVEAITSSDFKYTGATGEMTWDATGACSKVPQIVELG